MPVKHIKDDVWREVEKATVKAVVASQRAIKDTEMLNELIKKGLQSMTAEDYKKIGEGKK